MKLFGALAAIALVLPASVNPQLKQVNSVYFLGMSGGMDQFLANSFTSLGVFQVVTDPQKADAIVTDRLGETFESKLKELYPPPEVPKPVVKEKADEKATKDDKKTDSGFTTGTFRVGATGRGRGNIFIVDRKTRAVLWSIYEPPKDSSTTELSKAAQRIAKRLKNDLTVKATDEH